MSRKSKQFKPVMKAWLVDKYGERELVVVWMFIEGLSVSEMPQTVWYEGDGYTLTGTSPLTYTYGLSAAAKGLHG
jgi:hypothetical protein